MAVLESLPLSPEAFDNALQNMENCFCELEVAQDNEVELPKAELNLLEHLAVARDFMSHIVQLPQRCNNLDNVFGKDCARISRTRAVLEAAKFSDMNAVDQRFSTCLSACESVEKALQDRGLGLTLRRAQQCQRQVLQRKGPLQLCWDTPRLEQEASAGMTVVDLLGERESFLKTCAETQRPESVRSDESIAVVAAENLEHIPGRINQATELVEFRDIVPKSPVPPLPLRLESSLHLQTEPAESAQLPPRTRAEPVTPLHVPSSPPPSVNLKNSPVSNLEQPASKFAWPNLLERPRASPCSKPMDASVKVFSRTQTPSKVDAPLSPMLQARIHLPSTKNLTGSMQVDTTSSPMLLSQTRVPSITNLQASSPMLQSQTRVPSTKNLQGSTQVIPPPRSATPTHVPSSTNLGRMQSGRMAPVVNSKQFTSVYPLPIQMSQKAPKGGQPATPQLGTRLVRSGASTPVTPVTPLSGSMKFSATAQ